MIDTKTVVIGALLAVIAALFQSIPIMFSEILVFLTMFSAVPIYIACRINPKAGVLSYIVVSMLVMIISTQLTYFVGFSIPPYPLKLLSWPFTLGLLSHVPLLELIPVRVAIPDLKAAIILRKKLNIKAPSKLIVIYHNILCLSIMLKSSNSSFLVLRQAFSYIDSERRNFMQEKNEKK